MGQSSCRAVRTAPDHQVEHDTRKRRQSHIDPTALARNGRRNPPTRTQEVLPMVAGVSEFLEVSKLLIGHIGGLRRLSCLEGGASRFSADIRHVTYQRTPGSLGRESDAASAVRKGMSSEQGGLKKGLANIPLGVYSFHRTRK